MVLKVGLGRMNLHLAGRTTNNSVDTFGLRVLLTIALGQTTDAKLYGASGRHHRL